MERVAGLTSEQGRLDGRRQVAVQRLHHIPRSQHRQPSPALCDPTGDIHRGIERQRKRARCKTCLGPRPHCVSQPAHSLIRPLGTGGCKITTEHSDQHAADWQDASGQQVAQHGHVASCTSAAAGCQPRPAPRPRLAELEPASADRARSPPADRAVAPPSPLPDGSGQRARLLSFG